MPNKLLIIFIIPILLFLPSFTAFFSQDDFFHLRASQATNAEELIHLISPLANRGYAFFRPLSREVYNLTMWNLFGLNSLPYHIVQYVVFLVLLICFYQLVKTLFPKNSSLPLVATFLYSVSAVHLGTFYYLSSIQIILATIFVLISLNLIINNRPGLGLLVYFFALLSHEVSYCLPILLFTINRFLLKRKNILILPFALMAGIIFLMNLTLIKFPSQTDYRINLTPKTFFNTLGWYALWSAGIPEHLRDYVRGGLNINPKIIQMFPSHFAVMSISFIIFISLVLFSIIKGRGKLNQAFPIVLLYLVFLSPFMLVPLHRFIYYLIPAQLFLSLSLAILLTNSNKFLRVATIAFFFLINFNTIKWGEKTYWAYGRSKFSQSIRNQLLTKFPVLPKNATLVIANDPAYVSPGVEWGGTSRQAFLAMSGPDGPQLIYGDFTLNVIYEEHYPIQVDSPHTINIKI